MYKKQCVTDALSAIKVSRKLGFSEQFLWHIDKVGCQNFTIIAEITSTLNDIYFRQAVDTIQLRNPLLCCGVKQMGGHIELTSEDAIPIPIETELDPDNAATLDAAVCAEINRPFENRQANLIRIKLIKKNNKDVLLLTFNHVLCDAKTGVVILQDLLQEYSANAAGARSLSNTHQIDSLSLSIEDVMPASMTGIIGKIRFAKYLLYLFISTTLKRHLHIKKAEASHEPVTSGSLFHQLTMAQTQRVLHYCRHNKVTVQSLLCALMVKKTVDLSGSIKKENNVAFFSPVDMRNVLNLAKTAKGGFVSGVHPIVNYKKSYRLTELAKKIQNRMKTALDKNHHFLNTVLQAFILRKKDNQAIVTAIQSKYLPVTGVSNIGIIDIPDTYHDIKLTNVSFSISGHIFTDIPRVGLAASTFKDQLSLNLLYNRPYLSDEKAKLAFANIIEELVMMNGDRESSPEL